MSDTTPEAPAAAVAVARELPIKTVGGGLAAIVLAINGYWAAEFSSLQDTQVEMKEAQAAMKQQLWVMSQREAQQWSQQQQHIWVLEAEKRINLWARKNIRPDIEMITLPEIVEGQ